MSAVEGVRRRRGVHISTVATLLLRLPALAFSLAVLGLAAAAASGGSEYVALAVCVAFLLSGALTFLRPTEALLARVIFRVRRPTEDEARRLDHAWAEVTRAAGVDGRKYVLWIRDVDAVNAFATAGHTVAVTRWALWNLPPAHLTAVLAHELGHHLGGHAWATLLMYWYSLPGRFVIRVTYWCLVVASMATGLIGLAFGRPGMVRGPGIVQFLVALGVLGYLVYTVHPALLSLFAIPLLVAWFRRLAEKYADRVAADLGYGPALVQVFQGSLASGQGMARGIRGTLLASHPSHVARIKALEKRIGGAGG